MPDPRLVQGRIVWATIPDPNGVNPKKRPVVLLVGDADVPAGEPLVVVGVSTSFPMPLPEDHVRLPHSNDSRRPAVTRLNRPCAAVCTWVAEVDREAIAPEDIAGIVPPVLFEEIRKRVLDEPPLGESGGSEA